MEEETGARQIITSEYNKLRTEEYLHLRGRFYKRFPKCLESDYEFEQEIFLHYDILQAEIKKLESALDYAKKFIDGLGKARNKEKLGRDGMDTVLEEIDKIVNPTNICPICGDEKPVSDLHRNCGK